ncbi:peptide chain release factor N(5)-glutamine methyltransferase [Marilutibacter chinensis]|uniref:Release factor glutamine methyltransferase n=1 Tax=Marilutibacter chinensis TaxID=2912247 RepID=A0ABS9HUQ2_9GAMM|nr:peptide chain release factor N(5)-glutamine methyltransferase [Lysobacter chinensis]MCF7221900.1 peptide chain release factor N(5)-glutamine methyltransferase [Lysobacter chinensis]
MPRIDELLRAARGQTEPGDAEALLAHALGRPSSWLFAHGDAEPEPQALAAFEALLARRRAGEPIAYLTGRRGFWRFEVRVGPATLIPRPETERLVELALERLPRDVGLALADLGTGSGVIALALALERPRARIDAVDASAAALAVARENARELALPNIRFHLGDWFTPLAGGRYDLIASNPPYIAEDDPHLQRGDLRAEPRAALASGPDGLDAIREIAGGAVAMLKPDGWLLVEHGWEQAAAVRGIFAMAGLVDIATEQDLERRDRVTLGRRAAG